MPPILALLRPERLTDAPPEVRECRNPQVHLPALPAPRAVRPGPEEAAPRDAPHDAAVGAQEAPREAPGLAAPPAPDHRDRRAPAVVEGALPERDGRLAGPERPADLSL